MAKASLNSVMDPCMRVNGIVIVVMAKAFWKSQMGLNTKDNGILMCSKVGLNQLKLLRILYIRDNIYNTENKVSVE